MRELLKIQLFCVVIYGFDYYFYFNNKECLQVLQMTQFTINSEDQNLKFLYPHPKSLYYNP